MSNEQKLHEVVIDLKQKVIELCRLCNCPLPDWSLEQADKALATTEPEPTGMPEMPPAGIPEDPLQLDVGDLYTTKQMRDYGKQCWKAGYKHGAWADKPAVNQQLTTEPVDEREHFEKWANDNAIRTDLGAWDAWQARAAMVQGVK